MKVLFTGSALFILQRKIEYVFIKQIEKSAFFSDYNTGPTELEGIKETSGGPRRLQNFKKLIS